MDRSQSTSFQQVEDWLRGLGLLLYAQSFYDNGYEDIDTCKEINYEDLDVIGVKSERDREDIIAAVQKLKQNVYFVLEETIEKLELIKFEPIILKSKLKELLTTKNVQLIQPPYYFPDGTLGDLYPLAITLADELCTHFNDVLDGLEQLRKRQLPSKTYDQMNEGPEDERRGSGANDLPEYLNCEMRAMNRGYSFSKYDTRVTKSTTDLTKDISHERSASVPHVQKYKIPKGKAEDGKSKSRFGNIFRKDTIKSNKGSVKDPYPDFKANEISLSQTELCSMMSKVKNNEMSQDEVLAAVKLLSSGEGKQSPNTTLERTHEHSASLNKSKKNKISKQMIKRTPSATFYTSKDDSTPYMIPASENNSLERTRSGSSIGGDDPQSDKSSPEVGKTGIISKIRSSMRKKGKHDNDESNLSQSGSISSQENITLSDASASPEMKKHDPPTAVSPQAPPTNLPKPLSSNVYQQPIPVVPIKKPAPPLKPSKKSSGEFEEFQDDRDPTLHMDKPPLHCTKSENSYKKEGVKRLSNRSSSVEHVKDGVAPGRGLILDINKAKLRPVPKAPPRLPKVGSQEDESRPSTPSTPSTPVAPPRFKRDISVSSTPIETTSIDDIGRKMDNLIAGLDTRLHDIEDNYVDDSRINEFPKFPPVKPAVMNKPRLPSRRPVMPPKPIGPKTNLEEKSSIFSNESVKDTTGKNETKSSTFVPLPLKRILWKKLRVEGIPIHETPYTKDGEWNVPRKLVIRYAEELGELEDEIIKVLDQIRQEECNKVKIPFVEYRQKDLDSHDLPTEYSLEHWLVYNGLPMFAVDLKEVKVTTIQQINELSNNDFRLIGVYQENHVHYLKMAALKEVGEDSFVIC